MRRYSALILCVLMLSACGSSQPATNSATSAPAAAATAEPISAPATSAIAGQTSAPATAATAEPTSAPATAATAEPTSAPATATTAEPTSAPATSATAEPTSALILPPTTAPTVAAQPTTKPAASLDAPPTAKPAAQPNATAAARPTEQPAAPQPPPPQPPAQSQQSTGEVPVRLVIDAIGLDNKLESVGLDKQRLPIVPDHNVGWYNLSAGPGAGENIVLWGHVLRFRNAPNIPAPFARLKELKTGSKVVLYDRTGAQHNYVVTQQVWATPDQVEYILPQGKEMVTMVSCIGDKVISNGEVIDESHRLITIAEPEA